MEEKKLLSEEELASANGGDNVDLIKEMRALVDELVVAIHQSIEENPDHREEIIESLKGSYFLGFSVYDRYMAIYPNG